MRDAIIPTTKAAIGSIWSQLAVTHTRPESIPLTRALKSILLSFACPVMNPLVQNVKRPDAEGAKIELTIALSAYI